MITESPSWAANYGQCPANFAVSVASYATRPSLQEQPGQYTNGQNLSLQIPPPPHPAFAIGQKLRSLQFAQAVWKKACEGWSWLDSAVTRIFSFAAGAQAQEIPLTNPCQIALLQDIITSSKAEAPLEQNMQITLLAQELAIRLLNHAFREDFKVYNHSTLVDYLKRIIIEKTEFTSFYDMLQYATWGDKIFQISGYRARELIIEAAKASNLFPSPSDLLTDVNGAISLNLDKDLSVRQNEIVFSIEVRLLTTEQILISVSLRDLYTNAH